MKERKMQALSITVRELANALGKDHPMVAGAYPLGLERRVVVDQDQYDAAVAECGTIPIEKPSEGETKDA